MPHRQPDALFAPGFPSHRRAGRSRDRLSRIAALLGLALCVACAGCASTGMVDEAALTTGSIRQSAPVPDGKAPHGIIGSDWTAAKRALHEALDAPAPDPSVPWENAATGARGTATPLGPADAAGCRDFLIAVVDGKEPDRWIRGAACRKGSDTVLSQVRLLGKA